MSLMSLLSQPARLTDVLYLSAAQAVTPQRLRNHGITCIVNATLEVRSPNVPGVEVMRVQVEDVPYSRLGQHFDRVADRIHEVGNRGGRTIVHCVAGVSRSSSLCIAYLMKYLRMNLKQAYNFVKARRAIIRPNVGFFKQLIEYERKLFGRTSVKFVNSPIGPIPDVYQAETRNMLWMV